MSSTTQTYLQENFGQMAAKSDFEKLVIAKLYIKQLLFHNGELQSEVDELREIKSFKQTDHYKEMAAQIKALNKRLKEDRHQNKALQGQLWQLKQQIR